MNNLNLISFHGKQEIKDKYLARVIAHRKSDSIIQGAGWKNGKGCAVGCTLENYDHSRYPIELGLPEWLARLEDIIFEKLPKEEAILWPERFLSSIPIGVNVEPVKHKLGIARMDKLIKLQEKNNINSHMKEEVICAINAVKKCHEAALNKKYCDWVAAEAAAWSAARAAEAAAWSAAEAAAWSATWAAGSAEAAEAAAWSAEAAGSATWKEEADLLLKLLNECIN